MSATAADLREELVRLDALDALPAGPASLQTLAALEAGRQARVVRRAEILALLEVDVCGHPLCSGRNHGPTESGAPYACLLDADIRTAQGSTS